MSRNEKDRYSLKYVLSLFIRNCYTYAWICIRLLAFLWRHFLIILNPPNLLICDTDTRHIAYCISSSLTADITYRTHITIFEARRISHSPCNIINIYKKNIPFQRSIKHIALRSSILKHSLEQINETNMHHVPYI